MTKYKELSDPNSCFNKADDTEILFVLRSKDLAMAATIRFWIKERLKLGLNNPVDDPKITEALDCAREVERIQNDPRRV